MLLYCAKLFNSMKLYINFKSMYALEIKLSAISNDEFDLVALISGKSLTNVTTILLPHVQFMIGNGQNLSVCLFI